MGLLQETIYKMVDFPCKCLFTGGNFRRALMYDPETIRLDNPASIIVDVPDFRNWSGYVQYNPVNIHIIDIQVEIASGKRLQNSIEDHHFHMGVSENRLNP